MLPGCWLPLIFQPFAQIQHLYSNKTTLSPLIQHVVSAAMRVNLVSQQRTHKFILGAFFFILEIALIASNRAPQSRFITPVLTLLAGLPHQRLDPQKCFRSLLELVPREETWQCRSGTLRCTSTRQNNRSDFCTEVAHVDTVLVLCRDVMHFLGVDRALVEHMCGRQTMLTVTHYPACFPVAGDRPAVSWKSE